MALVLLACLPAYLAPVTPVRSRSRPVVAVAAGDSSLLVELWEGTPKSLLRIGKAGAAPSHANSLMELVAAHPVVAVKFNGRGEVDMAARKLCALAQDAAEDVAAAPVLLATRTLRRGGAQGLFAQQGRVGDAGEEEYYARVVAARKARADEDAKYEALRSASREDESVDLEVE